MVVNDTDGAQTLQQLLAQVSRFMILHAQAKHGKPGLPWLVFLHGFSGDCHEWQEVGEVFADYSRLYVDLPGVTVDSRRRLASIGFDDVTDLLRKPWLVTTSLTSGWWGTRLADGWR